MLGQLGHPNRLFRNQPRPRPARDVRRTSPRPPDSANTGGSRAAAFADLDNDGDLDLVVVNDWDGRQAGSPSHVCRNDGDGTFADVTAGSGFAPVGYLVGGLSLADYNRDGRLDLYISLLDDGARRRSVAATEVVRGQFPAQNRLYRNLGDFRFTDVTATVGLRRGPRSTASARSSPTSRPTAGPTCTSRSTTGRPVLPQRRRHVPAGLAEEFGSTTSATTWASPSPTSTATACSTCTSPTSPTRTAKFGDGRGNTLLRRRARAGRRASRTPTRAAELGVDDTGWGWGTAFTDIDLDGRVDLYAAQGMQEFIAQQSPELRAEGRTCSSDDGGRTFRAATDDRLRHRRRPAGGGAVRLRPRRRTRPAGHPGRVPRAAAREPDDRRPGLADGRPEPRRRAGGRGAGRRSTVGGRRTTQVALYGGSYLAGMPLELYFGLGTASRGRGRDDHLGRRHAGWTSAAVDGDRIVRVTPDGVVRERRHDRRGARPARGGRLVRRSCRWHRGRPGRRGRRHRGDRANGAGPRRRRTGARSCIAPTGARCPARPSPGPTAPPRIGANSMRSSPSQASASVSQRRRSTTGRARTAVGRPLERDPARHGPLA